MSMESEVTAGMEWVSAILKSKIDESCLQFGYRWSDENERDFDTISRRLTIHFNLRKLELPFTQKDLSDAGLEALPILRTSFLPI